MSKNSKKIKNSHIDVSDFQPGDIPPRNANMLDRPDCIRIRAGMSADEEPAKKSTETSDTFVDEETAKKAAEFYQKKREASRKRYAANPEKSKAYNKKRRAELKELKTTDPEAYALRVKPKSKESIERGRVYARERYRANREENAAKQRELRAKKRVEFEACAVYEQ